MLSVPLLIIFVHVPSLTSTSGVADMEASSRRTVIFKIVRLSLLVRMVEETQVVKDGFNPKMDQQDYEYLAAIIYQLSFSAPIENSLVLRSSCNAVTDLWFPKVGPTDSPLQGSLILGITPDGHGEPSPSVFLSSLHKVGK